MNAEDIQILNDNIGRVVKIICFDGECLFANIVEVSEEDQDVWYELVSTNRESNYEKHDKQPGYRVTFNEIKCVEAVPPSVASTDEIARS